MPSPLLPASWPDPMKHGDRGPAIAAWQALLLEDGLNVPDLAGQFGDGTHNATLAWQRARGLGPDGVVGEVTRGAIAQPRIATAEQPAPILPVTIPYVEALNWGRNVPPRSTVLWFVIHCTDGAEASTKAERVATWFAGKASIPAPRASAHYAIDSDSVVQMVPEDRIAWHAPGGNEKGIGVEHAGLARQSREEWLDDFSKPMLLLSAQLAARVLPRWNIPVKFIDAEGLKRGEPGITTHHEVTKAFKRSTHVDPGASWPMDFYLEQVQAAMTA